MRTFLSLRRVTPPPREGSPRPRCSLDRNTKAPIAASTVYTRAWDRLHWASQGALGRAALGVLSALLWVFYNASFGVCFPSYETTPGRPAVPVPPLPGAMKVLEFVRVLTWQNRIARIRERCHDLFGRTGWRWRRPKHAQ